MARPKLTFLADLVQAITGGDRLGRKGYGLDERTACEALARPPLERLSAACNVLMGRIGDASRVAVAEQALQAYSALSNHEKHLFFVQLRDQFDADPRRIRATYADYDKRPSAQTLASLFRAVEPPRQNLLRRLNTATGATLKLVHMRADLLSAIRNDPSLKPIDSDFEHLFASWFNRGFLRVERIDWSTSAEVLEKIMSYETVHPMKGWDDLRRRLDPTDRRVYAFFHPATGSEPLIFVEVALMDDIPSEIAPILSVPAIPRNKFEHATTAVFYSINNTLAGLKGVSFGNFLIKQVVNELVDELPTLKSFVTLSPVPGFAAWLENCSDPYAAELAARLGAGEWSSDEVEQFRPKIKALAATYLTSARTNSGMPSDPVARFHLGNGACAWRVNWPADLAPAALARSYGLMINYLYELTEIETRHEAFVRDGTIATGAPFAAILAHKS